MRKSVVIGIVILALVIGIGLGFAIGRLTVGTEQIAQKGEEIDVGSIIWIPEFGIVFFPGSVRDKGMLDRITFQATRLASESKDFRDGATYGIVEGKQCLLTPFGTNITVSDIKMPNSNSYLLDSQYTTTIEKDGTVVKRK